MLQNYYNSAKSPNFILLFLNKHRGVNYANLRNAFLRNFPKMDGMDACHSVFFVFLWRKMKKVVCKFGCYEKT